MHIHEVQAKLDHAEAKFDIAVRAWKRAQADLKRSKSQKNVAAYFEAQAAHEAIAAEVRDLSEALHKAHRKAEREAYHAARAKPLEQMALF
jgi:uncharacterized protein YlxW (UPF0749 family)